MLIFTNCNLWYVHTVMHPCEFEVVMNFCSSTEFSEKKNRPQILFWVHAQYSGHLRILRATSGVISVMIRPKEGLQFECYKRMNPYNPIYLVYEQFPPRMLESVIGSYATYQKREKISIGIISQTRLIFLKFKKQARAISHEYSQLINEIQHQSSFLIIFFTLRKFSKYSAFQKNGPLAKLIITTQHLMASSMQCSQ